MHLTRKDIEDQQQMFNHYGLGILTVPTVQELFALALKALDEPKAEEAPAEPVKPKRAKKVAE